jgi:hypothetical protein
VLEEEEASAEGEVSDVGAARTCVASPAVSTVAMRKVFIGGILGLSRSPPAHPKTWVFAVPEADVILPRENIPRSVARVRNKKPGAPIAAGL